MFTHLLSRIAPESSSIMSVINNFIKSRMHKRRLLLQNKLYSAVINDMRDPVVTINQGKVRGAVKQLFDGTLYYSFKGIPYAQSPVGALRFMAPHPPKYWTGICDTINHGSVCPQYDIYISSFVEGNEDCLSLNVYTKSLERSSKLPVMVFIHGGAFLSGSGNSDTYGPEYLCQQDVILVTLNYRLEVLGFLCLDTKDVPGNAGMKDQVMALKWVRDNIEKFGGDPDNVTLFGESAGGAASMLHMFSPMSQGLFHKVIAQSGTCIQDWAIGSKPKERAFRVGKLLGKNTSSTTELLNYLRSLPAIKLARLTYPTMTEDEKYRGLPIHFNPVLEKEFDNVENFLTKDPVDLLLAQKIAKVPIMIGYTSGDGIMPLADQIKKADVLNKEPSYMLPKEIVNKLTEDKKSVLGAEMKKFYFGNRDISKETMQELADLQTDRQFSYNSHRFAHYYSKFNKSTYLFKFDLETDLNIVKKILGYTDLKGVCHTEELYYLFSTKVTRDLYQKQEKIRYSVQKITKLWTDFAKTGDPTPQSSPVAWEPYTPSGGEYMYIGEDMKSCARADPQRMALWNKMYAAAKLPSM